jgi:hypothetical protein
MNKLISCAYLIAALAAPPVLASDRQLAWDWEGDESRITELRIYQDGTEHYTLSDPTARTLDTDTAGLTQGAEYTMQACNPNACSEPSNAIWIPQSPGGVKLIITF